MRDARLALAAGRSFKIGDRVEFELGPDGFCTRWTHNGHRDRGPTGEWVRGVVEGALELSLGRVEYIVETTSRDRYHFEVAPRGGGYPAAGLRLANASKDPGLGRLVERTDPVSRNRYYAVESANNERGEP